MDKLLTSVPSDSEAKSMALQKYYQGC